MKRNLLAAGLVLLMLALCLGGCTDSIEIRDRNLVLVLGIDMSRNGRYVFSFRFPVSPQGQAAGGDAGLGSVDSYIIEVEARSIMEAISLSQYKNDGEIFLGHLQAVIVSREAAENGVGFIINDILANPKVRRGLFFLISEGRASEILTFVPPTRELLGNYISSYYQATTTLGKVIDTDLDEMALRLYNSGIDPVAGRVAKNGIVLNASGGAIFCKDRFVGWLTPEETEVFNLGHDIPANAIIAVPCKKHPGKVQIIRVNRRKHKIEPSDSALGEATITVALWASLVSITCEHKIDDDYIAELSKELNKIIDNRMQMLIKKLQRLGSDLYGVSLTLIGEKPGFFNKSNWRREYSKLKINTEVKSYIEMTGSLNEYVIVN